MKFHLGITPKLTLIFLVFVGILLAGFGIPSSIKGRQALEEAVKAELYATAAEKETSIEYWLASSQARITGLANARSLIQKVYALNEAPPGSPQAQILRDQLVRDLWEWTSASPDYRTIMVLHPRTGVVIASTDASQEGQDKAKTSYFIHGILAPYVQSLGFQLSPKENVLTISAPLHNPDGLLVGVLTAEVNLDPLWTIVRAKSGMHRSDNAYLINQSRAFVTQPRDLSVEEAVSQKIYTEAANRCLSAESGVISTVNYRGVQTVTAYHWLANRQACLILDLDEAEAVAPTRDYSKVIVMFAGLALLVSTILAYVIARSITRPVVALQQGVARFTNGELDVRFPVRSTDEIGQLEQQFNHMAEALSEKETRLGEYAEELEQMVQERTEELRVSESEMSGLVSAMTDVILVIDQDGVYRKAPNAAQSRLIRPAEEMIGKRLHDVLPPEQADTHLAVLQKALQTGTPTSIEYSLPIDGALRWYAATASPISPAEVVWVARDITGLKQTEMALLESQRSLTTLLSNLPGMAYRCSNDENWTMEFVSDGCLALTGYPAEDLVQSRRISYSQLVHPDDRQMVWEMIQYALLKMKPFQLIYRIHTQQGDEKWVWEQGRGIFAPNGSIQALEGFVHDITERETGRQELQKNEQKFRNIIEQSSDGIVIVDPDGAIVEWNQAQEQITGLVKADVIGRPIWDIQFELALPERRTPERAKQIKAVVQRLIAQGDSHLPPQLVETNILRPDGERRILQSSNFTIPTDQGFIIGSISRDLTEQKRAEIALRESEERYRRLVLHAPDIIFTLTPRGVITSLNPAFETLTGHPADAWIGKPFFNLLHPESLAEVRNVMTQVLSAGTPPPFELRILGQDGRDLVAEFIATPIVEDGNVASILGLARDATDRKLREKELEALLKLSTGLRASSTQSEMFPVILDTVTDLFHSEAAALSLLDAETNELIIVLGRGRSAQITGVRTPAPQGFSAAIINPGTPQVFAKTDFGKTALDPALIPDVDYIAGIPLNTEEQTIGILWMGRNAPITPEDIRLLTALSEIAASSLHRAELHEQMERSLQRLSALNMIDRAINSSLDLRVTLNVFLSQVTAQLHVDAADILLLNPHTNLLEYTAGKGFRGKGIEGSRLRLGEGLAGKAALDRQSISLPNLEESGTHFIRSYLIHGEDFASYFCVPLLAKGHLKGVMEVFHRAPLKPDQEWMNFFESLAGQATIAIDNAQLFDDMQRTNVDLALAYDATIEGWSHALDLRDRETEGHTRRVVDLTLQLAQLMQYKAEDLVHLRRGALLHDIGKMGIPDAILLKPGPLNDEERAQMRKHPVYALELLSPIGYLRPALDIPYSHHEKWDGTGYPRGLKGEEIPLSARIFAVVDVWDALISDRPYRKAWSKTDALKYIREQSGLHFDPQVVRGFLSMISQ